MFHALGFRAGVVIAVSFQEVDNTPNAEARADGDHEGLENVYRRVEEIHTEIWSRILLCHIVVVRLLCGTRKRRPAFGLWALPGSYSFHHCYALSVATTPQREGNGSAFLRGE